MREPRWDVVVIGAGPAGALAARHLAARGFGTLLVDRQVFPRSKVCGGCLNRRALAILASEGLSKVVDGLSAAPVSRLSLAMGGRAFHLRVPGGLAVTRRALDAALVGAAVEAGVVFESGVRAEVNDEQATGHRTVRLLGPDGEARAVTARIVVAADGLGHPSLRSLAEFRSTIAARSRIGVGALVESGSAAYETGTVSMAIGAAGYAGVVRIGHGELNVAAAVDPVSIRRGGAASAVAGLLADSGMPVPEGLEGAAWSGTPALTQRLPRPVSRRIFAIGDASGYVEPLSGEGIAWALTDAAALGEVAAQGIGEWSRRVEDEWVRIHRRRVVRRQRLCRLLHGVLGSPRRVAVAFAVVSAFPRIAEQSAEWVNAVPSFVGGTRS